jgi:hypothetical protein
MLESVSRARAVNVNEERIAIVGIGLRHPGCGFSGSARGKRAVRQREFRAHESPIATWVTTVNDIPGRAPAPRREGRADMAAYYEHRPESR